MREDADDDATHRAGEATRPARALAPGLYVVAVPIGNLRDITLRALDVLRDADMIACEDTRVTQRLLSAHGLSGSLTPYHDHNAAARRPGLLRAVAEGKTVALVSDAGTPLVSDPGYKLVAEAVAEGLPVIPIPGASAALAALVGAGLPSDRFLFAGFPPPKQGARRAWLGEVLAARASAILYEGPSRLAATLRDIAHLAPDRRVAVMRELTKLHEEHRHGPPAALAETYEREGPPRGEVVIVVGPPEASEGAMDEAAIDRMLADALATMRVKEAANMVAEAAGRPKKEIYARALAVAKAGNDA